MLCSSGNNYVVVIISSDNNGAIVPSKVSYVVVIIMVSCKLQLANIHASNCIIEFRERCMASPINQQKDKDEGLQNCTYNHILC